MGKHMQVSCSKHSASWVSAPHMIRDRTHIARVSAKCVSVEVQDLLPTVLTGGMLGAAGHEVLQRVQKPARHETHPTGSQERRCRRSCSVSMAVYGHLDGSGMSLLGGAMALDSRERISMHITYCRRAAVPQPLHN
jgi:hypothetical protein